MSRALNSRRFSGQDIPEKRQVGPSFSRAASAYDRSAELQRQVGEDLLAGLGESFPSPGRILDVGAGTGYCTARLAETYPAAETIALDLAEGMLHTLRARMGGRRLFPHLLRGDAERLPLADACLDLIFSNLALQWCANLPAICADFKRMLRPGGRVRFSTFGEGTLSELREAWSRVDGYAHVNRFLAAAEVDEALAAAGFERRGVSVRRLTLAYPSVEDLMRALKGLGAHNITLGRARGLTGKGKMRAMTDAYRALMPAPGVVAGFEVILAEAE
jgi:malonyl-CoA O-methyltransferase